MTAARLDELAVWADGLSAPLHTAGMAEAAQKYADLARCARGWAALERRENCELFAYPKEKKWSFYPDLKHTWLRVPAETAIEAVEAAEVKP